MKAARFAKLERKVRDIAAREARRELMQVPWGRFHKAYEDYIRWQAFVLWVRSVVELEGSAPSWLTAILRKRCPGFTEESTRTNKPEPPGLQLLRWIHNQVFGFAKDEGWLDALVFFGFRDTRSQGYWTYWEHCESQWKRRRPKSVPTFAEWSRSALNWKLQGDVRCAAVVKAVEKYLHFEEVVYWLCPLLLSSNVQLPPHVAFELSQEYPGLREFVNARVSATYRGKSRSWRRLFKWGKDHVLSHAKKEGWLDCVLRQVRHHPLHTRVVDYAAFWGESRPPFTEVPYPSLRQWRNHAKAHVTASQK